VNSLRFRLILGFALVAIVPLVLVTVVLSERIQETVRAQAADRLTGALGTLQAQLGDDGGQIAEKLTILGRDGTLKRLFLVEPVGSAELSDFLAEKEFLLGLDFLLAADTSGSVVARAEAIRPAATAPRVDWPVGAGIRPVAYGLQMEPVPGRPALALAASVPIPYRNEVAGVLRGGIVLDASRLERLRRTSGVELTVRDAAGAVVATTLSDSLRRGRSWLTRSVPLAPESGSTPRATLEGAVSTAAADRAIATLRLASLLVGLLGLALAVVLGTLWSLQISRPVERLARFSERIARGEWEEPLSLDSIAELSTLVSALDRMRGDLRDYRERLVASERHAAWGLMARKVAHEIKNPLTPIAVSVADLKRSFQQQRADFPAILDQAAKTIEEEVHALKALLQEFSEFGRLPEPRPCPCRLSELIVDLRTLYAHETTGGRLTFVTGEGDPVFSTDRAQLRQALVNLVQNGLEAVERGGRVTLTTRVDASHLEISVADDGAGLTAEQRSHLFVPFFTTKAQGSGLGLTIVERIVHDLGGTIAVESEPGRGTTFRIRLPIEPGAR
jgi:nitrogen fixation/metabolism regulation signal transduction histidine kinase